MLGAILYKEWIKTYKIIFLFLFIFIYSLFQTFLDVKNSLEYYEATSVVLNIVQLQNFNFNNIQVFCLVFSLLFGAFQFYPEVNNGRIRLFLHLPMSHTKLITIMIFSSISILVFVFAIISFVYYLVLTTYYPEQIFYALYSKLFPSFLASIFLYLTTCLVFMEPNMKKKIVYLLVSLSYLYILVTNSFTAYFVSDFMNILLVFLIFIYLLCVYEVFESYKKGYIK